KATIDGTAYGTLTNIVDVSGKPQYGNNVTSNAFADVEASEAGIIVTKLADPIRGSKGTLVNFTMDIRNGASSPLIHVYVEDVLPAGLTYNDSSPVSSNNGQNVYWSDIGRLDVGETKQIWLKATIDGTVYGTLTNNVDVSGKPQYGDNVTGHAQASVDASEAGILIVKKADPTSGSNGTLINFTMDVTNNGASPLIHVFVKDQLPDGLLYNSSSAVSYSDKQNVYWPDIGRLDVGQTRQIWLSANIDGTKYGTLTNVVDADGKPEYGNNVTGRAQAEVIASKASINVTKTVYPEEGTPDTIITYNITVNNNGSAYLCDVFLEDTLPAGIEYISDDHGGIFDESNNIVSWYDLDEGNCMAPGENILIKITAKVVGTVMGVLDNKVYVSGIPRNGGAKVWDKNHKEIDAKPVPYVVTKTSDKQKYRPGEEITYTIKVCNMMKYLPLENVVIKDVFQNAIEIVYSDPEPGSDGLWHYDIIPPNECIEITIVAKAPLNKATFDIDKSDVAGSGFVNVHNDLSTAVGPYTIKNCVYVTATVWPTEWPRSTCHSVTIEDLGTELETREHGSGDYSSEEVTHMKWENKSIESKKSTSASYYPTAFSLPGDNSLNYTSKWTSESRGKNYITGAVMHETYRYADDIDRDTYVKMDENGSEMKIDSSFTGKGSIGFFKKSSSDDSPKIKPIFDSQEDYNGRFSINESFEEYGSNIDTVKRASGEGLVSSDTRVRSSQRTYESGTGSYKSEELVDSFTSYIAKDIELEHRPISYNYTPSIRANQDMKWTEGMWSKNGILRGGTIVSANNSAGEPREEKPCNTSDSGSAPATLISERYSSLEYLKKDSVALGLNEMKTNATFEGVADFRAKSVGVNATDAVDNDERYAGSFSIDRHVLMTGVAKYDYPHITVSKILSSRDYATVNGVNSTVVDYEITITNDGNRALAPIYVWDSFPAGTEYLSSSFKPAELSKTTANWTILHLGIGNTLSINLRLNVTEFAPYNLVNCVTASGIVGTSSAVSSSNCTSLELDYLGCCQPKVSVAKKAQLDPMDSTVIRYIIQVKNSATVHMAA
ncbi:MAG: hypothetical protein PHO70_08600, partial [Candidatus Omnitrophica bacterium]|nr:hypothetical protein [Candidatus Omnitrophota bacterium]